MPNDINGDDYYNANATFYDGKVQAFYSDNTFFSSSENGEKTSLDIGSTKNFRSMMWRSKCYAGVDWNVQPST